VLFINQSHYSHIRYAPSKGTNNQVEFIALWTLLAIAQLKGVKNLQVMGESKLLVDWALKKVKVENVRLGPLLRDIQNTLQSFEWLSFKHI